MLSSTRRLWAALGMLAVVLAGAAGTTGGAAAAPSRQLAATPTPTATPGVPSPPGVVAPGVVVGARGPVQPLLLTATPPAVAPGTALVAAPNGSPTPVVANPYAPLVGNLEVAPAVQPTPGATVLVVPPGTALLASTATPTPPTAALPGPFVPAVGAPQMLPSPIPTATWTPTPTNTPTPTSTATLTPTPTVTPTVTPSIRAPANLRVVSAGPAAGMYTISWDPGNVETVMEYHVQAVGAGGELRPLFTVPGSGSQAVLQGLDPAIGYTLVIRAVDVLGRESGPSNVAQTAVAPTATPVTPPFGSSQPYGSGSVPPGGQVPSSPYGPPAPGGAAPYGAPQAPYSQPGAPYNAPASPYGPARPGLPPGYQPGVTAPPPVFVPTPTVSIYQPPITSAAPYRDPYSLR